MRPNFIRQFHKSLHCSQHITREPKRLFFLPKVTRTVHGERAAETWNASGIFQLQALQLDEANHKKQHVQVIRSRVCTAVTSCSSRLENYETSWANPDGFKESDESWHKLQTTMPAKNVTKTTRQSIENPRLWQAQINAPLGWGSGLPHHRSRSPTDPADSMLVQRWMVSSRRMSMPLGFDSTKECLERRSSFYHFRHQIPVRVFENFLIEPISWPQWTSPRQKVYNRDLHCLEDSMLKKTSVFNFFPTFAFCFVAHPKVLWTGTVACSVFYKLESTSLESCSYIFSFRMSWQRLPWDLRGFEKMIRDRLIDLRDLRKWHSRLRSCARPAIVPYGPPT